MFIAIAALAAVLFVVTVGGASAGKLKALPSASLMSGTDELARRYAAAKKKLSEPMGPSQVKALKEELERIALVQAKLEGNPDSTGHGDAARRAAVELRDGSLGSLDMATLYLGQAFSRGMRIKADKSNELMPAWTKLWELVAMMHARGRDFPASIVEEYGSRAGEPLLTFALACHDLRRSYYWAFCDNSSNLSGIEKICRRAEERAARWRAGASLASMASMVDEAMSSIPKERWLHINVADYMGDAMKSPMGLALRVIGYVVGAVLAATGAGAAAAAGVMAAFEQAASAYDEEYRKEKGATGKGEKGKLDSDAYTDPGVWKKATGMGLDAIAEEYK